MATAVSEAAVLPGLQVCLLNYKKGKVPFWNQFFLAPIHDNSGVVEYYLGIQSDVTEQVESARLANTHLEGESWDVLPCRSMGQPQYDDPKSCRQCQNRSDTIPGLLTDIHYALWGDVRWSQDGRSLFREGLTSYTDIPAWMHCIALLRRLYQLLVRELSLLHSAS